MNKDIGISGKERANLNVSDTLQFISECCIKLFKLCEVSAEAPLHAFTKAYLKRGRRRWTLDLSEGKLEIYLGESETHFQG